VSIGWPYDLELVLKAGADPNILAVLFFLLQYIASLSMYDTDTTITFPHFPTTILSCDNTDTKTYSEGIRHEGYPPIYTCWSEMSLRRNEPKEAQQFLAAQTKFKMLLDVIDINHTDAKVSI